MFLHANSEDSDQTGRTGHFVGFDMRRLSYSKFGVCDTVGVPVSACFRRFGNGTNGMPMPSEISPLAAIGYHWLPMAFTIGSQSCRQSSG